MVLKLRCSAIFSLILLLVSCNNHNKSANTLVIEGFDNPDFTYGNLSIRAKFINLSDSIPLQKIHTVKILDEIFVLGTSNGVFCYDMEGRFLREISRKGRSSSEWITVGPVIVNEDQNSISIFDISKNQVMEFSIDGEFIGSTELPGGFFTVYQVEKLQDGKLAYTHGITHNSGLLFSIEKGYEAGKSLFSYETPLLSDGALEKFGWHPMSVYNDSIKLLLPFDNNIYELRDNKLHPIMTISTNKKLMTDKEIGEINNFCISEYLMQGEKGRYVGPNNIFENSTHILLTLYDTSFILVDKSSGRSYCFGLERRLSRMLPFGVIDVADDYFVGIIDQISSLTFLNRIPDDCPDDNLLTIKQNLENEIDSNPLIVLYQF